MDAERLCRDAGLSLDALITRCVAMASAGITREFPYQLVLPLAGPLALHTPRDVHPVFYGCYDWHSAVHSHWALVRACRVRPEAAWGRVAVELLTRQFTPAGLRAEYEFLRRDECVGFERPYGLAWLLTLCAELRQWSLPAAADWLVWLRDLEALARERLFTWLQRLQAPIRTGEHSQTALALGLALDWAAVTDDESFSALIGELAQRWHRDDAALPLHLEPSGHDFLSPSLGTADLMSRVLPATVFADWLDRALPTVSIAALGPARLMAGNSRDGKLAHFAGLNFSRAWMADRVARSLPLQHPAKTPYLLAAEDHLLAGLPIRSSEEYAVTHWVGTFALYAATGGGSKG